MKNFLRVISILLVVAMLALGACSCTKVSTEVDDNGKKTTSGVEDGVLTVAMECAYAPYNWAQTTDANDAVQIKGTNMYANGYDIMIAKKICEANGWTLEVVQQEWDSLIPAVQAGTIDATIAGQSMTSERMEQVDFAGPYLYASIVCLAKKDSVYANAKGLSDLAGGSCTSQSGTIWYTSCLPQIKDANVKEPSESAPAMLLAVESGAVDFVCTDMPTAQGALVAYDDLVILDFTNSEDNFQVSEEEINIGIAVQKGNTTLKTAIDNVLSKMTKDDFDALMAEAVKIQPLAD